MKAKDTDGKILLSLLQFESSAVTISCQSTEILKIFSLLNTFTST